MFIPFSVWDDMRLTPIEKLVYAAILSSTDKNGEMLNNDKIASIVGCSSRSVSRAIRSLTEYGHLSINAKLVYTRTVGTKK